MNKLRVGLLSLAAVISVKSYCQGLIGQDSTNKVITTAVPFLLISPDARAAGMGDVGGAISPDANGAFWNPAKMAFIEKSYGASFSFTPWLGKIINDMSISYLSGFYKISRQRTVAASMKYFDLGEIVFNTGPNQNQIIGRFNPREFAFDVSYSQLLTENFSVGGAIRYIHSNLTGVLNTASVDAQPGNSIAADVGVFYRRNFTAKNSALSLAATITNIGAKITYTDPEGRSFIPTNLRLGAAYKSAWSLDHTFTFAMDFNKLLVPSPGGEDKSLLNGIFGSFSDARGGFSEEIKEVTVSAGGEYWYQDAFALRAGYFLEAAEKGNRKYLTVGVGGRVQKFGLDVAYLVPTNRREHALAETLRFTLLFSVDKRVLEEVTQQ